MFPAHIHYSRILSNLYPIYTPDKKFAGQTILKNLGNYTNPHKQYTLCT